MTMMRSKTKVTLIGKLRYTEAEGVQYSINTEWYDALPNAETYKKRDTTNSQTQDDYKKSENEYRRLLHEDPGYQLASRNFLELQQHEPQRLPFPRRDVFIGISSRVLG
jgi:hypothetical protein